MNFIKTFSIVLLWLSSAALHASWIEPGEKISLKPDEGLALFIVDSDGSLTNIRIDMIGTIFTAPKLKKLEVGRSLRLLKLKLGEYQFDKAELLFGYGSLIWEIKDLPNRRFKIEAGKLNYVGDLKVTGSFYSRGMSIRNGGLRVFDELETLFPGLVKQYEWRYAGEYPDPFVEFYKTQQVAHPEPKDLDNPEIIRANLSQRDLAGLLFRKNSIDNMQLSPSGRYVLEYRQEGTVNNVYLIDLEKNTNRILYTGTLPIESAYWLNEKLLAITYAKSRNFKSSVREVKDSGPLESVEIAMAGNLYLAHEDGSKRVIFARNGSGAEGLQLFDLQLSSMDQIRKLDNKILLKSAQLRKEVKNDNRWWFDAAGVPRVARCFSKDKTYFEYFASAESAAVQFKLDDQESNPNDIFAIVGFDLNGKLLAISNRARNQAELVEFDPITLKEGAIRFSQVGADVIDVTYGLNDVVNGVKIKTNGRIVQEHFASTDQILKKAIEKALPGKTIYFEEVRANANRLVYAFGPKDPGSYYIYNDLSKKLQLLALSAEHLEDRPMRDTTRIEVESIDKFKIEAFLTLPASTTSNTKPPLLVVPHGGPIGVFDTERFDPEVQYFAQLGFAVVQINYRGSGGGGKATVNLGIGQYGRAIEADVDAVVDSLVNAGKVDANRIVAMGTSYGGYSALMLSLDKPERYKAAVSIAGITDILAQFSGGDVNYKKSTAEQLTKVIGDPRTQTKALQLISPVYRYQEFTRPIMLVHDRGDERVTFDQSERLLRLLRLKGKPPTTIFLQDNTHGLVLPESASDIYPKIAAFLFRALSTTEKPN